MKKKEIPVFNPNSFDSDFFNPSNDGTLMDSVDKASREIIASQSSLEPSGEKPEKRQPRISSKSKSVPEDDNDEHEDFISFLAGQNRRDTVPVRILRTNYEKIVTLRNSVGGSRSIPEIVDKILEMYLSGIEKQL